MSTVWVQTALRKCLSWETTMTMFGNSMRYSSSQEMEVQAVGGLVEEEHVGGPEEGLREEHADLDPLVDFLHEPLVRGHGNAQAGEKYRGLRLRLPSAELGELRLELGGPDPVGLGEVVLLVDGRALGPDSLELGPAHDHGIDDAALLEGEVVLGQHRHALARADGYLALVRLDLAGEELEEGGLARAVRPDDSVAVAGSEFEADVLEERALPEGERELGYAYHGKAFFA
jgi:hypothetical protein